MGYKHRNSLFEEKKKEEGEESTYLTLCLQHGKTYETECLSFMKEKLSNRYEFVKFADGISVASRQYKMLGTVDAYVTDKETGELGVLEIKCPYGSAYGRFALAEDDEGKMTSFDPRKGARHWLQLQLYLFLHGKQYGTTFGLLAYYYPRAGLNGGRVCTVHRMAERKTLKEDICMEDYLDRYFNYYLRMGIRKKEKIPAEWRSQWEKHIQALIEIDQTIVLQE